MPVTWSEIHETVLPLFIDDLQLFAKNWDHMKSMFNLFRVLEVPIQGQIKAYWAPERWEVVQPLSGSPLKKEKKKKKMGRKSCSCEHHEQ